MVQDGWGRAGQLGQDSQDVTVVKETAGHESCATVLGLDRGTGEQRRDSRDGTAGTGYGRIEL
jgi:hypothetical protein